MNTETELKYALESQKQGEDILKDNFLKEITVPNSSKVIDMKAVYYDDKDGSLAAHRIGYRVRKENDEYIATVKYSDKAGSDGLSRRHEYNIPVDGTYPKPEIFYPVIEDRTRAELFKSLVPEELFTASVLRTLVVVKHGSSEIEIAFDSGRITSEKVPGRFSEICELECELKSGNEEDLLSFGKVLREKFSLSPLDESKMSRGLSLISK